MVASTETKECTVLPLVVAATWIADKPYGQVFRLAQDANGTEVVVRVLNKLLRDDKAASNSMVMALLGLQREMSPHNHVARIQFAVYGDQHIPAMVSPWYANGGVLSYLRNHPEANKRMLATQASDALTHLHNHEIVHGNVYPIEGNVLVDDSGCVQVTDTALHLEACLWLERDPSNFEERISARYQAPELLHPRASSTECTRFTRAADVYALSATIFAMLSGQCPSDCRDESIGQVVRPAGFVKPEKEVMEGELWEILESCWSMEPEDRPCAMALLQELQPLRLPAASD